MRYDWGQVMNTKSALSAMELLRQLIRLPSPDPPGDERAIATFLANYLQRRGFKVDLDEFAPNRFNILVRLTGIGEKPGLVFSAHMDTLPAGKQGWADDPFAATLCQGRVIGRGASDMKSGLAAMVVAAEKLRQDQIDGLELSGDLVLAFTGGESSNCLGARRLVAQQALSDCGALLVSEPTSMEVFSTEMGALWLRVTAIGRSGHTSARDAASAAEPGKNAIDMMLAFLSQAPSILPETAHPLVGPATMSVGRIGGGDAINLAAESCWAEIDIRLPPDVAPGDIEEALSSLAGREFVVERIDYKAAVATALNDPFLKLCLQQTAKLRGRSVAAKGVGYFSDAAVLSPHFDLPMVIIGPGPLGGSGAVNEWCEVDALDAASDLYYQIARSYLSGN